MTGNGGWDIDFTEFDQFLGAFSHNGLLGHRYHAHGAGWVDVAMPWNPRLSGDPAADVFATGAIMALMDNSMGISVWFERQGCFPQVTVDLRIDMVRPPRPGTQLIGRGECLSISAGAATVRGLAYEDDIDDPVCVAAGTFMLLKGPSAWPGT